MNSGGYKDPDGIILSMVGFPGVKDGILTVYRRERPMTSTGPDIIEEAAVVQAAQGMLFGAMIGEGFHVLIDVATG